MQKRRKTHSDIVMVKNIGTTALLSDNAPLLPEKCCNYKCFGIHMSIYFVCIGKTQIWYHSTQNSKNGLDKIIGTLNLIFGSTPFGKNNRSIASCNHQWVSYTSLLEFWTTLLAYCSRCLRFEGCLLPTAVFRTLHRCSMGFRSGLIAGHFRSLQCFVLNNFCVLYEVLSCWKTHDLWRRPSFLTLGPTLRSKILW